MEGASAGLSSELGKLALNSNIFSNNKRGLYVVSSNFDSSSVSTPTFSLQHRRSRLFFLRLGSYTNNSGSGNGVDAIYISGTITQNGATATLLANSLPYLLNGSVTVAASSTLASIPAWRSKAGLTTPLLILMFTAIWLFPNKFFPT